MITTPSALVILTLGTRAAGLKDPLTALGATVACAATTTDFLHAIEAHTEITALLISGDIGRDEAHSVLKAVKDRYAVVPTIWLGDPLAGAPLGDFRSSPDAVLHDPAPAEAVVDVIRALFQKAHTDTVASLFVRGMQGALQRGYDVVAEASPVRVNAIHRLVLDVNTIVAFCGAGVSGKLLVSADEGTLLNIYRRATGKTAHVGRHEAEDLAGELANLAIGRVKLGFDQLGVECEIGTPLLVGRAGMILRPTRGQPSLCATFVSPEGAIRGELTLDRCTDADLEKLSREPSAEAHDISSEVCFL